MNRAPPPFLFSPFILPRWAATTVLHTDRPMPMLRVLSPCWALWVPSNRLCSRSSGMPRPLSYTVNRAHRPRFSKDTVTWVVVTP